MKAYVFPGQGSQAKGMGAGLFEQFPDYTAKADKILGFSIQRLCVEDPDKLLNKTQFTQPALFVVNALSYLKTQQETPTPPDYLAGHSLGEYNALLAAGIINFETGLYLVKKRGELMSAAAGGAMAAVLNCDSERIASILRDNMLHGIDIANFNSPKQIVLSGPTHEIREAQTYFENEGAMFIPLNVSAAFHSRYMKNAAEDFGTVLDQMVYTPGEIPVISNVKARPYLAREVRENLKNQISSSVQWVDSIRYLMGVGVTQFKEIGPGNVLTNLVKTIQMHTTPLRPKTESSSIQQNGLGKDLGCAEFRKLYNIQYAYLAGSMVKGIASKELVVRMGKAGLMGFYGTGGLKPSVIEKDIQFIQQELCNGESYGMNLLCNLVDPNAEMETVDLFLEYGITDIEAAAYIQPSLALIKFRLKGLTQNDKGETCIKHKVLAKISRPEVAEIFLNPPSPRLVEQLLSKGAITAEQARLSQTVALADALCVESDSGGHTDMGIMTVLLPTILRQRDAAQRSSSHRVRVGAAGGIGTPEAVAAAFILGAEFVLTGSINQCTVEAGTSDAVKDMLAQLNVQDTDYAPAGDMFELGAKIQVMKKGVFFPSRANKLYELWRYHNAWEEIDEKTRQQIETKYFGRTFAAVYQETKQYYMQYVPQEITKAEQNAKHKLALVFRWYFIHSMRIAMSGDSGERVNYQVHTGPALGAFNQWVKGTSLENWRNRHVHNIAIKLMQDAAQLLNQRFNSLKSEVQ